MIPFRSPRLSALAFSSNLREAAANTVVGVRLRSAVRLAVDENAANHF